MTAPKYMPTFSAGNLLTILGLLLAAASTWFALGHKVLSNEAAVSQIWSVALPEIREDQEALTLTDDALKIRLRSLEISAARENVQLQNILENQKVQQRLLEKLAIGNRP